MVKRNKFKLFCASLLMCIIFALSSNGFLTYAAESPWASFIEAETATIKYGNDISIKSDDAAIGGKVIATNVRTISLNNAFELKFTVPKDGEYAIWGRVNYPSQSANSLIYQLDGERKEAIWDFPDEDDSAAACYNTWHYFYLTTRQPVSFVKDSPHGGEYTSTQGEWRHSPNYLELEAGEHTILFTVRESGWSIDQFVITELKVDEYDPNYCEENNLYLETCKFCNADYWKHYITDVYAIKNVTPEAYFETAVAHYSKTNIKEEKQEANKAEQTETQEEETVGVEKKDYKKEIGIAIVVVAVVGIVIFFATRKRTKLSDF